MKTKDEILQQLEASKELYMEEQYAISPMYIKGWIYALQWVLSDDDEID